MSFDEYLAAQQYNIEQLRRLPHFTELILPVHDLYDRAVQLVPPSAPVIFGRLLLLSHRNFLSAAALSLRALPDDAAAVTRRAIEAARTALAFRHDRENLQRWIAEDERMARWEQRRQGEKPKKFTLNLTYPPNHELSDQLGKIFGILSDAAAHFTPEFLSQQTWRVVNGSTETSKVHLSYFSDQESVERSLRVLAGEHLLCLAAFDECYDGAFSQDAGWGAARIGVQEAGRRLAPAPELSDEETP
jgi:hypothetical protein